MDQDDPEYIKEKSKQLCRILDTNYKKADLEHEVKKITHLTKSQQVILLGCLKCVMNISPMAILVSGTDHWYAHLSRTRISPTMQEILPNRFIHLNYFKKDLNILVSVGVLKKLNCSEWDDPSFISKGVWLSYIYI